MEYDSLPLTLSGHNQLKHPPHWGCVTAVQKRTPRAKTEMIQELRQVPSSPDLVSLRQRMPASPSSRQLQQLPAADPISLWERGTQRQKNKRSSPPTGKPLPYFRQIQALDMFACKPDYLVLHLPV